MVEKYELIDFLEWLKEAHYFPFLESSKVEMVEKYIESRDFKNGALPLVVESVCLSPTYDIIGCAYDDNRTCNGCRWQGKETHS